MMELISDCVGCRDVGLRCRGMNCPYYEKYYVFYCDKCGEKTEEDGLCEKCLEDIENERV